MKNYEESYINHQLQNRSLKDEHFLSICIDFPFFLQEALSYRSWSSSLLNQGLLYASTCGHFKACELLLEAGADANHEDGEALKQACTNARAKVIEILIFNQVNLHKYAPGCLEICAANGNMNCFEVLCDYGADPRPIIGHLLEISSQMPGNLITNFLKHIKETQNL